MTREEFWCKIYLQTNEFIHNWAYAGKPVKYPDAKREANNALYEYDQVFSKRPTSEYTVDDLPPFDLLEDGVGISGVMFYRHYDQANQNFCLKTQKDDVLGGPYYSNTNNERDFKRWWETMAGAVVQQAVRDLSESIDSQ